MLGKYVLKRILIAVPTLLVISVIVFWIIHLPPGSFLEWKVQQMSESGQTDMTEIQQLRIQYRIDAPLPIQYVNWITKFVTGDLGESFEEQVKVTKILWRLVPNSILLTVCAMLLSWAVAVPFGIIAAVKKNSVFDYVLTFVGLAALATPGFVVALVFMVIMQGIDPLYDPTGLLSEKFTGEALTWAKVVDFLKHLVIPVFILGIAGSAGLIRIMRANVIDELKKQYVLCARARGLHPALVVLRYPVRVAINPVVSNIGLILPRMISGSVIIGMVLSLPILGPRLLQALQAQDTYLAADIVFIQCILAIVGILISDILLAMVDPRIKFSGK